MSEQENQLRELLRLLPWRVRAKLWIGRTVREIVSRTPGYRFISGLFWKARRGGWAGVFEPPFNIMKQDRAVYDKRLRWHQWGVLKEADGFRAYTPTRRTTQCFPTTAEAWGHLHNIYWATPQQTEWEPVNP